MTQVPGGNMYWVYRVGSVYVHLEVITRIPHNVTTTYINYYLKFSSNSPWGKIDKQTYTHNTT